MLSKPKPYGGTQPLLLNAGLSEIGQDFGVRNCDAFFTAVRASEFDEKSGVVTPDVAGVKKIVDSLRGRAAAVGRSMGVYTNVNVICRPTQKEAIEYYRYVLDERARLGSRRRAVAAAGHRARSYFAHLTSPIGSARSASSPSSATPIASPASFKR